MALPSYLQAYKDKSQETIYRREVANELIVLHGEIRRKLSELSSCCDKNLQNKLKPIQRTFCVDLKIENETIAGLQNLIKACDDFYDEIVLSNSSTKGQFSDKDILKLFDQIIYFINRVSYFIFGKSALSYTFFGSSFRQPKQGKMLRNLATKMFLFERKLRSPSAVIKTSITRPLTIELLPSDFSQSSSEFKIPLPETGPIYNGT